MAEAEAVAAEAAAEAEAEAKAAAEAEAAAEAAAKAAVAAAAEAKGMAAAAAGVAAAAEAAVAAEAIAASEAEAAAAIGAAAAEAAAIAGAAAVDKAAELEVIRAERTGYEENGVEATAMVTGAEIRLFDRLRTLIEFGSESSDSSEPVGGTNSLQIEEETDLRTERPSDQEAAKPDLLLDEPYEQVLVESDLEARGAQETDSGGDGPEKAD